MTEQDLQRLEDMITKTVAAFPSANATDDTGSVYAEELCELNLDDLDVVLKQLRRTARFLPTIAEIFEAYENYQNEKRRQRMSEIEAQDRAMRSAPGIPMPKELKPTIKAALSAMDKRRMH